MTMQGGLPHGSATSASGRGQQPPPSEGVRNEFDEISRGGAGAATSSSADVRRVVAENPVIVIGRRGCCMCHVANRLLLGLGVNPAVYEVGEEEEGGVLEGLREMALDGDRDAAVQFPAVFVGGKLFGGLEKVMASHISGELEPVLREAGALWL